MAILLDDDPAVRARKAYEAKHGSGSVKTKRLTSEELRKIHGTQVEESASAELGRLLRATLPFLRMGDEALVGELVFHPPVDLKWPSCPQCCASMPNVITKPMRQAGEWNRGWRFDWAFPGQRLGIEVQGQGRHQRYVGYREDCEKLNSAIVHGWRVLWFVAAERKDIRRWVTQVVSALGPQQAGA